MPKTFQWLNFLKRVIHVAPFCIKKGKHGIFMDLVGQWRETLCDTVFEYFTVNINWNCWRNASCDSILSSCDTTLFCSVSALTWFFCVFSWWEVYQTGRPQQRSGHLPEYTHHNAVLNFLSERVQVRVLATLPVCMQGRDLEPPAFLPQVYSR